MKRFAAARRRRRRHVKRQGQSRDRWGGLGPLLLDVVGLAALGGLVSFCTLLDQYQPFLYQGSLALVAITTAVVIAVTDHPQARLGTGLLGRWPLRWIGLRSYGIYLWHWPVFMVTRPELDVPITGVPLLTLRLAVTLVAATLVLADVHRVAFVNVKVPRAWEQPNNSLLAEEVQQYPNTVLVDWYAASARRPELFVNDGIHLRYEGQRVYTELISAHLQAP